MAEARREALNLAAGFSHRALDPPRNSWPWSSPVSRVGYLREAGFMITSLAEPRPTRQMVEEDDWWRTGVQPPTVRAPVAEPSGFLTPLMLREFPVQHLWPVFVAESASHDRIPPVHREQLEHGEETFPLTVRSQDNGRLDTLQILSAAGISGKTLEVSANLLCTTRRKAAADPVSQPLVNLRKPGLRVQETVVWTVDGSSSTVLSVTVGWDGIRDRLERLRIGYVRDQADAVFGANGHHFEVLPPLGDGDLAEAEAQFGVRPRGLPRLPDGRVGRRGWSLLRLVPLWP